MAAEEDDADADTFLAGADEAAIIHGELAVTVIDSLY